jgi:hypothetical protein
MSFSIGNVLTMRRTVLNSIVVLSLTALTAVVGACATAPAVDEDFSGLTQDQTPVEAQENNSAKLPAATNPSKDQPAADAGAADAKAPPKDASTPPKDASPPPVDSGGGTTGGDCDPNDPIYAFKAVIETSATPCPCSASQCCYLASLCLSK